MVAAVGATVSASRPPVAPELLHALPRPLGPARRRLARLAAPPGDPKPAAPRQPHRPPTHFTRHTCLLSLKPFYTTLAHRSSEASEGVISRRRHLPAQISSSRACAACAQVAQPSSARPNQAPCCSPVRASPPPSHAPSCAAPSRRLIEAAHSGPDPHPPAHARTRWLTRARSTRAGRRQAPRQRRPWSRTSTTGSTAPTTAAGGQVDADNSTLRVGSSTPRHPDSAPQPPSDGARDRALRRPHTRRPAAALGKLARGRGGREAPG